jgi:uncharacterized protein
MNSTCKLICSYPLTAFFAIAYTLTWIGWIVPDLIYTGTWSSIAVALPLALLVPGPLYASLIVTMVTDGRRGVMVLLRKFAVWRVGWKWFAVALLMAPLICLAPAYINMFFGAANPTHALIASSPSILFMFLIRLFNPFDGPMQEELGWRGFALPRLQERHSALAASAILGGLVVIWHLPLVMRDMLPVYALPATFAFTILFGWLFNNAKRSVLMTLIAHAADGLILTSSLGLGVIDTRRHMLILVVVWCLSAVTVVILFGSKLVKQS